MGGDRGDLRGDDHGQGGHHERNHERRHPPLDPGSQAVAGRGPLGEDGQPQRQGDHEDEGRCEWPLAYGRDPGARENDQPHWQEEGLGEHEHRGGRQDALPGAARDPGEDHDVVDAGRQEDEQEPHEKGGGVGDLAGQDRHHQRCQDEVDDQERRNETGAGEGCAQTRQRNSEKGRVQQRDQDRVDDGLQGSRGRRQGQPRCRPERQGRKVEGHLVALHPCDRTRRPASAHGRTVPPSSARASGAGRPRPVASRGSSRPAMTRVLRRFFSRSSPSEAVGHP